MFERARRVTHELADTLVQAISPPFHSRFPRLIPPMWTTRRTVQPASKRDKGKLVLVGGEVLSDDVTVELIHLAGGRRASVSILGFDPADRRHLDQFRRFGIGRLKFLDLTRLAQSEETALILASSEVIVITGSETIELTRTVAQTPIADAVRNAYAQGSLLVGIGKGVAPMGEFALSPSDDRREKGLGLLSGALIDERLDGNGRWGRLLSEINSSEGVSLGLAIDDETAIVVDPENDELRVIGERSIIIVDGRMKNQLRDGLSGKGRPATDMLVHVLYDGQKFDLFSRRPIMVRD